MPYTCDNASVGVLITRHETGELLLIKRAWFPIGYAPVAGHVFDEHSSYEDAARAEVAEEVQMTVESLFDTGAGGWHPNRCGAENPGSDPRAPGHEWKIYVAVASGEPHITDEAKEVGWYNRVILQTLAERTVRYARGEASQAEFENYPGLEPIWVGFLNELGMIEMRRRQLEAVAYVAEHGKPQSRAGNGPG